MTPVARQIQHTVQPAIVNAVVVAVANLSHVEREILAADVVKLPDDRAAHDAPERLNGVGVRLAEAELIDVADRHQIACGKRPNHTTLVAELVDLLQGREVIAAVCRALRERGAFWEGTDAPIVGEPSAVPHPTKQEAML